MKTLYEVNWHYVEGDHSAFEKCSVSPVKVIREGLLPGCTGVSITAIGADGRKFLGSPKDYFNTEAEAWDSIKSDLLESISGSESTVRMELQHIAAMRRFLEEIQK